MESFHCGALAHDQARHFLFYTVGIGDTWDPSEGGDLRIQLEGVSGRFRGMWSNPRTGELSEGGIFEGGQSTQVSPPNTLDWVLWLKRL